jgi:hypothetical protein
MIMNNSVTHSFYDTIRSFGVSISISAKLSIHGDFSKLKPIKAEIILQLALVYVEHVGNKKVRNDPGHTCLFVKYRNKFAKNV